MASTELQHVQVAFLYLCALLAVVRLGKLLAGGLCRLRASWEEATRFLQKWCPPAPLSAKEQDIHVRSQRLAGSWRLERFMRLAYVFSFVACLPAAVLVPRHIGLGFDSAALLKESAMLPTFVYVGIFATLITALPGFINLNVALLIATGAHIFGAWAVLHTESMAQFFAANSGVGPLRVAQCAILGNLRFNVCLQLLWSAVNICQWCLLQQMGQRACLADEDSFTLAREVTGEAMIAVLAIIVGIISDQSTYAQAKATVESRALRQFDATAQSFLSVLCDAVIYLDSSLRLSSPSPKLAALLLRESDRGGDVLLGKHICDFVAQEHRDGIQQTLESLASESTCSPPLAQSITTVFKDSSGSRVDVQILCSRYLDLDDVPSVVIGIRELDMEQVPLSAHDMLSQASVLMDIVHFKVGGCEPSRGLGGFRPAKDSDFRQCLADPSHFEEHVRQFFEDSCLDVFEEAQSSEAVVDENEVGSQEIIVRRPIGRHKLKIRDKQSRAKYVWDAHLTLESSPGLFSQNLPMM
eukprot:gb/GFBE01030041.1/.p1 GENE.gb/GFBE01030041.1/~~gb/GFBE01030041.1/.p1  ORF type:complete len:526 (+),score=67.74 gb/GFBE01030041.1/:1-1578(+)